jgi:hypothetical protein
MVHVGQTPSIVKKKLNKKLQKIDNILKILINKIL